MNKLEYFAKDDMGRCYINLHKPKRGLMKLLNGRHCERLYAEWEDGTRRHIGWIIDGVKIQVFYAHPYARLA